MPFQPDAVMDLLYGGQPNLIDAQLMTIVVELCTPEFVA